MDEELEIFKVDDHAPYESRAAKWGKKIVRGSAIIVPIFAYAVKYGFFATGRQGTMGILALCFVPIFLGVFLAASGYAIFAIIYGLVWKDGIPALTFVALFVLAIVMPLLPIPPNEAEKHFYDHRAAYEEIVAQAKQGSLPKYTALNADVQKTNPLVIIFDPLDDFYDYIAYAAKKDDLDNTNPCDYDGGIVDQIGDTWWLCFREWN